MNGKTISAELRFTGDQGWVCLCVQYPDKTLSLVRLNHDISRGLALNECLYLNDLVGVTVKEAQQKWDNLLKAISMSL